jgi:hypothetical protein
VGLDHGPGLIATGDSSDAFTLRFIALAGATTRPHCAAHGWQHAGAGAVAAQCAGA